MTSVIEILFARRPCLNYVSPAACEAGFSGSGFGVPIIVLSPFGTIPSVGGLVVAGEFPGPFSLSWEITEGAVCYNVYQVVDGELILILECVPAPPPGGPGVELPPGSPEGGDTYVVTPITPEGEGPPGNPVTTPTAGDPGGPCVEIGSDTTCAYGSTGERYRIKNYNANLFDISDCGLSFTNCVNCEIFPDTNCVDPVPWTGTFPVKVNDGHFIDQEFEPDIPCGGCPWPPAHLLHGFCIAAFLVTGAAPNSTGCGWYIEIDAPFVAGVWTGVKSKGEGPEGIYIRNGGCCPGPACVEIEAY